MRTTVIAGLCFVLLPAAAQTAKRTVSTSSKPVADPFVRALENIWSASSRSDRLVFRQFVPKSTQISVLGGHQELTISLLKSFTDQCKFLGKPQSNYDRAVNRDPTVNHFVGVDLSCEKPGEISYRFALYFDDTGKLKVGEIYAPPPAPAAP